MKPREAESFEAFVPLKEGPKLCCQYAKMNPAAVQSDCLFSMQPPRGKYPLLVYAMHGPSMSVCCTCATVTYRYTIDVGPYRSTHRFCEEKMDVVDGCRKRTLNERVNGWLVKMVSVEVSRPLKS